MEQHTEDKWQGRWRQLSGKIKEEWNEITDDDLEAAEGRLEYIAGKVQERHGIAREKAMERLEEMKDGR